MSTLEAIIDRIKQSSGVDKDADVAKELGISKGKLATSKARGSIPYRDLIDYAMRNNISIDWLLTGRGERQVGGTIVYHDEAEPNEYSPDDIRHHYQVVAGEVKSEEAKKSLDLIRHIIKRNSVGMRMKRDFVTVPLHDVQGSCGDGSVIHSEQIVDYLAFKREWVSRVATNPKRLALIEAAGDSMMPTIHSGDLLLLDLCITRIEQDAIYAISVDGMLYIKRIQKRLDGTVIVKSDNPNYEEQRFTAEEAQGLRIVGRVIWMGKRI